MIVKGNGDLTNKRVSLNVNQEKLKHVGTIYGDYVILGHGLEERQLCICLGVFVRDISMINYDMLWLSALECGKSRLFAEGCNFC